MRIRSNPIASCLALAGAVAAWSSPAGAAWTPLTNLPVAGSAVSGYMGTTVAGGPAYLDTCLLLTDATVMCHEYGTNHWHRLSPDVDGLYQSGTWDAPGIADMPPGNDSGFDCTNCTYAPLYFASAVLPDGRVIVIGGEDNNSAGGFEAETNIGFVYNPFTNAWSSQLTSEQFGGYGVGDAQSVILQDGTFLLAQGGTPGGMNIESFDAATLTFTALNPTGKLDFNAEEGWNILSNGMVLTVDSQINSTYQLYNPATNAWSPGGATPVNLPDLVSGGSSELGPAVQRPDGTLVYFSGNSTGQNAVYNTLTNTWLAHSTAMDFPVVSGQTYHFTVHDGPASALPNGNVLVMASPSNGTSFLTPSHFYEFSFATNTLSQVADSPNAASLKSYQGRMLALPTGEVLLTAFNQCLLPYCSGPLQDVAVYTNGGAPESAWAPSITSVGPAVEPGATYSISGTLFNGFSEGAFYGDDAQMSSNYPLVQITSAGQVFYARTHDHSQMGVEAVGSTTVVTTQFDTPTDLAGGPCTISVVTNGIASAPVSLQCCEPGQSIPAGGTSCVCENGGTWSTEYDECVPPCTRPEAFCPFTNSCLTAFQCQQAQDGGCTPAQVKAHTCM